MNQAIKKFLRINDLASNGWFLFLVVFCVVFFCFFAIEAHRLLIHDGFQAALNGSTYILSTCLLLVATGIYYLAYRLNKGRYLSTLILFIALSAALSFLWPLTSSDIFSYISQARVFSIHNLNPYLYPFDLLNNDIYFESLQNIWSFKASPYGPVFLVISGLITKIFAYSFWWSVFGLKFLFVAVNIISAVLIYRHKKDYLAFFLFAFNPLILFEVAINGHNDALFTLFLIVSVLMFNREKVGKKFWSYLFLSLSALTKYYSIVLVPLWFIIDWREAKREERVRGFCRMLVTILVPLAFYLPFGSSLSAPLISQGLFVGYFLSPFMSLINEAFSSFSVNHLPWAIWISRAIFIAIYVWILREAYRKGNQENFLLYSCLVIAALFLLAFTWLMPWYFVSLLALLCFLHSIPRYRSIAVLGIIGFTTYGVLNYLILR